MLYITSGDGTSDSDTNVTGQKMDLLLAKVLRIDVDHPSRGKTYSVPADNPFVGRRGIRPETVRLDPGETVTGKVSYQEGRETPAGVTLIFTDQQGLNKMVSTDERGRYSATGFMSGTYNVRARLGDSRTAPQTFSVGRGANKFDYEIPGVAAPQRK
jgi:hypothetical protein